MNGLLLLIVGAWLGYELKKIMDNPHQQPETTRQYLSQQEPKCPICLYCDDKPEPGEYFCKEHLNLKTA